MGGVKDPFKGFVLHLVEDEGKEERVKVFNLVRGVLYLGRVACGCHVACRGVEKDRAPRIPAGG